MISGGNTHYIRKHPYNSSTLSIHTLCSLCSGVWDWWVTPSVPPARSVCPFCPLRRLRIPKRCDWNPPNNLFKMDVWLHNHLSFPVESSKKCKQHQTTIYKCLFGVVWVFKKLALDSRHDKQEMHTNECTIQFWFTSQYGIFPFKGCWFNCSPQNWILCW